MLFYQQILFLNGKIHFTFIFQSGGWCDLTCKNLTIILINWSFYFFFQVAKLLIDADANVNEADILGATALHKAAAQGRSNIVELLLTSPSIHVDPIDSIGCTPLWVNCKYIGCLSYKMTNVHYFHFSHFINTKFYVSVAYTWLLYSIYSILTVAIRLKSTKYGNDISRQ